MKVSVTRCPPPEHARASWQVSVCLNAALFCFGKNRAAGVRKQDETGGNPLRHTYF